METSTAAPSGVPRLRRTLTLWDLIFYGIVLIQPIAPVHFMASRKSFPTALRHHHLIALFAMLITAVSYGRMGALIQLPALPIPTSARDSIRIWDSSPGGR